MQLNRRDFLKASAGVSGLVLLQPAVLAATNEFPNTSAPQSDIAMLVDASKCIGCWWCYAACKNYNKLPETIKPDPEQPPELSPDVWTTLNTTKRNGEWSFRKQACNHCIDAACVEVCPTGALSHNKLGFIQYDKDKCSGCGYCAEFCPFGVPQLDSNKLTGAAVMDKCTFCIERVTNDQQPACAAACPTGAIKFGRRSELLEEGKQRVAELNKGGQQAGESANISSKGYLYGENELGGLHVMYVLDDSPESYGLPADPQLPPAGIVRNVFQWVGIGGLVAIVAGFGLNYIIAREAKITSELPGKEQMGRGKRNG